jgi:hypothetical protein
MKVRKNVCIAKNIKFTTNFMLESVFLHRSEADVIAKKSNYRDLDEFKTWIVDTEQKVRNARKLRDKEAKIERRVYAQNKGKQLTKV